VERGRFNPGSGGGGSVTNCLDVGKQYSVVGSVPPLYQGQTNVNLWPPFSVTVTPVQPTAPCSTYGLVSHKVLCVCACVCVRARARVLETCSTGKVFTQLKIHIVLFWVMVPCNLVGGYKYFGAACSSEMLTYTDQTVRCCNLDHYSMSHLYEHCMCVNLNYLIPL
jgi:hypothetical protein